MERWKKAVLIWFGVSALISWALIPIRVFLLFANDWLVGALMVIGLVFIGVFFLLYWIWKARNVKTPLQREMA